MKCDFVCGQRVVFIGLGNFPQWPIQYDRPVYGHVYTVREVRPDPYYPHFVGLLLKELVHPRVLGHPMGIEYACEVSEWRPAVDRKTDISIFQKMLTNELETTGGSHEGR